MRPILQLLLVLLVPFAVLGFVVIVALGPFLAGIVLAFGGAALVIVALAVEASLMFLRWREAHHWRVRHVH